MEYRLLGRTGLRVSPLCLGTMNFGMPAGEGVQTEERRGHQIMDRGLELGINFFDTANVYGGGEDRGDHRPVVRRGRRAAGEDGPRHQGVRRSRDPWPNTSRLSALHIRQACEDSLRRMQTDHIDLYQMHHVDRDTPWDEIWQAMDLLVAQGKVIYVGSSNFAGWHIVKANEAAARRGSSGWCPSRACTTWTPGLSSSRSCPRARLRRRRHSLEPAWRRPARRRAPEGDRGTARRRAAPASRSRPTGPSSRRGRQLCAELGDQPADVALAWLLHNPAVTAPIIGPRTVEQLDAAMAALDVVLEPDILDQLDKIFPGPGGPAPEAYAW